MEAVIHYCDENDIDVGTVNTLVNKSLKEKIKTEATKLKMLKGSSTGVLPV